MCDKIKIWIKRFQRINHSIDGSTRQRQANYDFGAGTANLTSVKTWLTGSETATVSFDYDAYGNIEKVTHEESKDENGNPFYYEYTYDNQLHTYPVHIEDAFGYSSNPDKGHYLYQLRMPFVLKNSRTFSCLFCFIANFVFHFDNLQNISFCHLYSADSRDFQSDFLQ